MFILGGGVSFIRILCFEDGGRDGFVIRCKEVKIVVVFFRVISCFVFFWNKGFVL